VRKEHKETDKQSCWGQERCVSVKEEGIIGEGVTGISHRQGSLGQCQVRVVLAIAQNELNAGFTPGQAFMWAGAVNVVLC